MSRVPESPLHTSPIVGEVIPNSVSLDKFRMLDAFGPAAHLIGLETRTAIRVPKDQFDDGGTVETRYGS